MGVNFSKKVLYFLRWTLNAAFLWVEPLVHAQCAS